MILLIVIIGWATMSVGFATALGMFIPEHRCATEKYYCRVIVGLGGFVLGVPLYFLLKLIKRKRRTLAKPVTEDALSGKQQ